MTIRIHWRFDVSSDTMILKNFYSSRINGRYRPILWIDLRRGAISTYSHRVSRFIHTDGRSFVKQPIAGSNHVFSFRSQHATYREHTRFIIQHTSCTHFCATRTIHGVKLCRLHSTRLRKPETPKWLRKSPCNNTESCIERWFVYQSSRYISSLCRALGFFIHFDETRKIWICIERRNKSKGTERNINLSLAYSTGHYRKSLKTLS